MRLSSVEGGFTQVHQILTAGVFLTALALALGASPWHIGLIAAVPHFTQIFQLIGAYLVEATGHRKPIALLGSGLSRSIWLFLPLLFLYPAGAPLMPMFITLVVIASALELVAGNAWTTWMADLIPESIRGRYFGYRNGVLAAVTIAVTMAGGVWLEWGRHNLGEPLTLTAVLLVAGIAGGIGVFLLYRQPDIERPPERKAPKVKELLLAPVRNAEYRKALEFFLVWNLAIGFVAPFIPVHLIQVLSLSYVVIGAFQAIKPLVAMALFRWWGQILDSFQIRAVMMVSGAGVALLPFLWLLPTREHTAWLWVIAVVSGLAWTGFNLSAYTYPMRHSPRIGRSYYLAYFSIVSGLGFVASSITGGWIAQRLVDWEIVLLGRTYMAHHLLFMVSGFLRIVALLMLLRLKRVTAPGTTALITRIGAGIWRTASLNRPFPRWIRKTPVSESSRK